MDNHNKLTWLERPIHPAIPVITNEIALFAGIMILAVITRFYDLESRVMSHDESLHTYFSWLLYRGQGYQHSPMMHGPWQFHWIALSYFLFGVSDFTARIPAVLFSIATVWMVWKWRRYLGGPGMLIAGVLMVISPYMLYYGRYVRNESYAGLAGILLLYAMLRYLENGGKRYLYLVTAATLLHFTAKETAFIYTAQALLFLGVYFVIQVTRKPWEGKYSLYRTFIFVLIAAAILLGAGAAISYVSRDHETLSGTETAAPANPSPDTPAPLAPAAEGSIGSLIGTILLAVGALALLGIGLTYLLQAYVWHRIPKERSFDLLMLLGTFVLPMLTAFPIKLLEERIHVIIPTDAGSLTGLDTYNITVIGSFVAGFLLLSILAGMLWDRDWWKYAIFFWGLFTIFYTTVFTNAAGFFTGIVGSLGYWIVQQSVERGSQPEYYYVLVQIPMYEFLPALGTLLAIGLGLKKLFGQRATLAETTDEVDAPLEAETDAEAEAAAEVDEPNFGTFFGLTTWWVISSILAFTIAGERMPWLTYHMAWPMILMTGWAVGQIVENVSFQLTLEKPQRIGLAILVMIVFLLAAYNTLTALYGATPPFQGSELVQLQATAAFLLPLVTMILAGALLWYLMKDELVSLSIIALMLVAVITFGASILSGATLLMASAGGDPAGTSIQNWLQFAAVLIAFLASLTGIVYLFRLQRPSALVGLVTLTFFGLLFLQTVRVSVRANYIDYDNATEYLVYAHGARGVKDVMAQVEEISERTAGGLNAVVAYDSSAPDTGVSWPFVWYLRDFTALRSFDQPSRSLREAVAVIVDQKNFDKINAALGDEFYEFDYIRMWWPNQDYFNLDKTRVLNAITNPQIRQGIFDIWLDRDYTKYAEAVGSSSMTLTTWQPADQMKLFVRKDVAAKIWNYGVGPSAAPVAVDPYEGATLMIAADQIFGADRYLPLGLNAPRAIAVGQDEDLYVADSRNHRILHVASDGSLLHEWGTFGSVDQGEAPSGTFNEPWGVAVGPDGSVYVSDTWNHRVQKFTKDGKPLATWGQYGQPAADNLDSKSFLYGPRGIAVDSQGRVFLADTGNKRIVIFDEEGNYLTEFGTAGFDVGQFDEPVGVAVANDGTVFVTDTWNQRVQSFLPDESGTFYTPLQQWEVNAWFGQSLDNKPLIAVSADKHVFITDPEGYRVIEFTDTGQFVRTWGDFGTGPSEIGLAAGVAVDPAGVVWVTDAGNNRILRYTLP